MVVGSSGRRVVVAVSVVAVVVVSCSGGDVQEEQAELLGLFVDADDPEALFDFMHRDTVEVQERIVACMAEAGFEYRPVIPARNPAEGGSISWEEYQARFGWGMMSSWEETLTGVSAEVDPNAQLREQMDEATLVSWEEQLYGDPDSWYDEDDRQGCEAQAEYQVNAFRETEAWAELEPLLWEIPERAMADPRWAAADRDWSRCMAEQGYQVANVDEAIRLISETTFDAWEVEPPPPGEPPPEDRMDPQPWFVETETWQELIEFELELMQAHLACEQDPHDLIAEYQQAFLDDNQDLILQLQDELTDLQQR